jgi:putative acetyltransferase
VHLVGVHVAGGLVAIGGIELQPAGLAELKRFYVRPAHRGTGVGDALMAAVLEHASAQGVRLVRLETGDRQHLAEDRLDLRGCCAAGVDGAVERPGCGFR